MPTQMFFNRYTFYAILMHMRKEASADDIFDMRVDAHFNGLSLSYYYGLMWMDVMEFLLTFGYVMSNGGAAKGVLGVKSTRKIL